MQSSGTKKRGFWQRGLLQNPVSRPRKEKLLKDIGPSSTCGAHSATAKSGVDSCKNPVPNKHLLKEPFSWHLKSGPSPKKNGNPSATKMTGRPGHWSERGEYNILFLGSILVISSQDSSALGYREFTQEGPMTISPFAAREGTSAPQRPNVKKCCHHLVPSSDLFVQSYAVPNPALFTCFQSLLQTRFAQPEDLQVTVAALRRVNCQLFPPSRWTFVKSRM